LKQQIFADVKRTNAWYRRVRRWGPREVRSLEGCS